MAAKLHEVIVVGGGPAGAALAILLRRQGHAVTLLERAHMPRPKPCGESLSPEATPILADLGVLEEVRAGPHGSRSGFVVYPYDDEPFCGTYAARSDGNEARMVGLCVPRLRLDTALLHAARRAGTTVCEGWMVRDVGRWDGQARTVRGTDAAGRPFVLRTALLVAADGVHSTIAHRLGLVRSSHRLRQLAIVMHMQGIENVGAYGEMHVTPTGYCGVAPLSEGIATVALVVPAPSRRRTSADTMRDAPALPAWLRRQSGHAAVLAGSPREAEGGIGGYVRAHLRRYPYLGHRLRDAEIVAGPWTTGSLAMAVRRRVDDGLLLVGDAGGYYDPFTGEGIYRGLRSAILASEVAAAALTGNDTRCARLQPYARAYRREFAAKRLVEMAVHEITTRRPLFEHVSTRLRRQPHLADVLVGTTGDFISPYEVLNPLYLARLFL